MHAARSDDEGTSPILGARAHRDRKQGSEQLLISLLVRTALEPERVVSDSQTQNLFVPPYVRGPAERGWHRRGIAANSDGHAIDRPKYRLWRIAGMASGRIAENRIGLRSLYRLTRAWIRASRSSLSTISAKDTHALIGSCGLLNAVPFGFSRMGWQADATIGKAISRIPEFMMPRQGFYPRGGGPRWRADRPYHVALEDTYIRTHWDVSSKVTAGPSRNPSPDLTLFTAF